MQGYPISPATEISEHMVLPPPQVDGVCMQMEDKTASVAAVIGVSYADAKGLIAASGPGFDLMTENIVLVHGYHDIACTRQRCFLWERT